MLTPQVNLGKTDISGTLNLPDSQTRPHLSVILEGDFRFLLSVFYNFQFIPKYFILFYAIVNGIFVSISVLKEIQYMFAY